MDASAQHEQPPQQRIMQMLTGFWISQSIHVAAKLKLADLLANGPQSATTLAESTNTHAESLYRLLRALASVGIFTETQSGTFTLTPMAECLRSDVPGSQYAAAMMMGDEHYLSWADLLHSIRTGETGFEHRFGKPIFDYMDDKPETANIFDAAMTAIHGAETQAMLEVYDFSPFHTLVDIGGGNGTLIREVLLKHADLKGIVFDRPHVTDRTTTFLNDWGLTARCHSIGGDFFHEVPSGGDAYLLRHIIHDWTDEQSLAILKNIRKVIPDTGKLLLVESVIPPGNEPNFAKLLDLNMLVIPGGKERTEKQYTELYEAAGFRLQRIVPTRMGVDVIEGVPG